MSPSRTTACRLSSQTFCVPLILLLHHPHVLREHPGHHAECVVDSLSDLCRTRRAGWLRYEVSDELVGEVYLRDEGVALEFEGCSVQERLVLLQEKQRQLAKHGLGSPLMIATDVVAQNFLVDSDENHVVNVLKTSRGDLCFPDGKTSMILAAGVVPATNILLNSLESMQTRGGSRLTR
ncbi:hypothetical protein V8D89_014544 [Ganoderma adspersum]